MNASTAHKLVAINDRFYQNFAEAFSATRMRLQPGVKKILEGLSSHDDILDLGCGNGALARELARRGHQGRYVGLDFSPDLLTVARQGVKDHPNFHFVQGNLAQDRWESQIRSISAGESPEVEFDVVFAFATLHHLPGRKLLRQTLHHVHNLLKATGRFIHSNWQFLNSERLRKRIQPWSTVGLSEADVDPGDYLLDWRRGGHGLRFVHHFTPDELQELAWQTGFTVLRSFLSDGEGGNLGLYQIWGKTPLTNRR